MSKEITKNFLKNNPPMPTLKQPLSSGFETRETTPLISTPTPNPNENLTSNTFPSTLLSYLMEGQMASLETNNPWGITTDMPATIFFNQKYFTKEHAKEATTTAPFFSTLTPSPKTPTLTTQMSFNPNGIITGEDIQENFLFEEEEEMEPMNMANISSEIISTLALMTIKPETFSENTSLEERHSINLETTEATNTVSHETTSQNKISIFSENNSTMEVPKIDNLLSSVKDNLLYEDISQETYLPLDYSTQAILNLLLTDTTQNSLTSFTTTPNSKINNVDKNISTSYSTQVEVHSDFTEKTDIETTSKDKLSMYPQVSQVKIPLNSVDVSHLISKSSSSVASDNAKPTVFETNVLTPFEIAPLPKENVKNLAKLQADDNYNDYQVDDSPIYLEDLTEVKIFLFLNYLF